MAQLGMIPPELRALPQWVVWKIVERDGKPTKPPFNPRDGSFARTHDQEGKTYPNRPEDTWGTFEEAGTCIRKSKAWGGIGFVFTKTDPYVGIDIDDCMTNGKPNSEAKRIVNLLDSYTEKSPSGTGIHIIVRGSLPEGGRRRGDVEMYEDSRYFTFTGETYPNHAQIEDRQEQLEELHSSIFGPEPTVATTQAHLIGTDSDLIEKAKRAKNGGLFCVLYEYGATAMYGGDDSRADLALCDLLAFWAGPDPDRINRLFRGSALYRTKWDRADYSRRTITKALANKTEFYSPDVGGHIILNGHIARKDDGTIDEDSILRPTESGSADRVVAKHAAELRHAYNENIWYTWHGNRWMTRNEGRALQIVELEMRSIWDEARKAGDDEKRKELGKYALRTESNRYMRSVLDIMRRRTQVTAVPRDFDADPFLLNCPNGTLDLRNGDLREHRREDLLTKLCGCRFDASAPAPLWRKFVDRVIPDTEVRDFLQRACGYALTGNTHEQCFFFLHGDGSNGKSTFAGMLLAVMGDYGLQAAPDLLISHRGGERVPTDVAELEGRRFVATIEIDEGRRLAEGLVKQMTGGDRMKARYMRQDFFEFEPSHKIFMAANHRPVIRGTDLAIWRRVMLVPFTERISDDEKDPHLPAKLRDELPGILAWCLWGCLEWQRYGLRPPAQVVAATEEYRTDQDTIGRFIGECCELRSHVKTPELVEAYRQWCHANGETPQNTTAFGRDLTARGYGIGHDGQSKTRTGLTLTQEGRQFLAPKGGMFS